MQHRGKLEAMTYHLVSILILTGARMQRKDLGRTMDAFKFQSSS